MPMPFIEYECVCTMEFELLRNINATDDTVECPNCCRVGKVTRKTSVPMQSQVRGGTGAGRQAYHPR